MPGTYLVTCDDSNFCYIGATSRGFKDRFYEHKTGLKCGEYINPKVQYAYDKCGPNSFESVPLDECETPELNTNESFWYQQHSKEESRRETSIATSKKVYPTIVPHDGLVYSRVISRKVSD